MIKTRQELCPPWQSCSPSIAAASWRGTPGCSCPGCAPRSRWSAPRTQHTWTRQDLLLVNVTEYKPRYELRNCSLRHRHHGDGLVGGQPVGLVVPTGVVTNIVEVTEHEGHRVELCHTRTSNTCKRRIVQFVSYENGLLLQVCSRTVYYLGPGGETSHCPLCRGGSSRPTSWSLPCHRAGWRMTGCAGQASSPCCR